MAPPPSGRGAAAPVAGPRTAGTRRTRRRRPGPRRARPAAGKASRDRSYAVGPLTRHPPHRRFAPATAGENSCVTVLDCSGSGRGRGRAHGEQARPLVTEAIQRWAEATLGPDAGRAQLVAYAEEFLAGTGLMGTVDRLLPDL